MAMEGETKRNCGPRWQGEHGHGSDGAVNRGHDHDDEADRRPGIDSEANRGRGRDADLSTAASLLRERWTGMQVTCASSR